MAAGDVPEGGVSGRSQANYEDKRSRARHQNTRVEARMYSQSDLFGFVQNSDDKTECDSDEFLLVRPRNSLLRPLAEYAGVRRQHLSHLLPFWPGRDSG